MGGEQSSVEQQLLSVPARRERAAGVGPAGVSMSA